MIYISMIYISMSGIQRAQGASAERVCMCVCVCVCVKEKLSVLESDDPKDRLSKRQLRLVQNTTTRLFERCLRVLS